MLQRVDSVFSDAMLSFIEWLECIEVYGGSSGDGVYYSKTVMLLLDVRGLCSTHYGRQLPLSRRVARAH
jgi:hypothetical protein